MTHMSVAEVAEKNAINALSDNYSRTERTENDDREYQRLSKAVEMLNAFSNDLKQDFVVFNDSEISTSLLNGLMDEQVQHNYDVGKSDWKKALIPYLKA